MLKFEDHLFEQYLLNESLNSPQEYYLTDDTTDTDMYASFSLNGKPYIIALTQSKILGVYLLQVGRITTSKPRWWTFYSPKDVLPVLSTVMHFMEATMAFKPGKVQGIFMMIRGKRQAAERMGRFAKRMVKRSFVKSFQYIDVQQPPEDKIEEYSFYFSTMIMKKGLSPKAIFNKAHFKKYDFDGIGEVPADAVNAIKTKKPLKKSLSTAPSKKYSFSTFDVDLSIDDEVFDNIIQSVKPIENTTSEPELSSSMGFKIALPEPINDNQSAAMFGTIMTSMSEKLKQFGYDESKIIWDDLEYVIKNQTDIGKKVLSKIGITLPLTDDIKNKIKEYMQTIANAGKDANGMVDAMKYNEYFNVAIDTTSWVEAQKAEKQKVSNTSGSTNVDVLKSNIDPATLKVGIEGASSNAEPGSGTWYEPGEDIEKKKNYVKNTLGYYDKVEKLKNLSTLTHYTGHSYDQYNDPLREVGNAVISGGIPNKTIVEQLKSKTSKYNKLFKCFQEIEPLPEPMWVYRGGHVKPEHEKYMQPGEDYIDPAFMSTSLKSEISFGYKLRLRIYLPKGSKVVPALDSHSNHGNEKEILLPPMSVIKIIEVIKKGEQFYASGIFIGSAYESFVESLTLEEMYGINNLLSEKLKREILEAMKKDKYDAEQKLGGTYEGDMGKKLSDMIKQNLLKVKNPTNEKD